VNANDWLLDIARQAKLPGVERLPATLDGSAEEAWAVVCGACDLDPRALAELVARLHGLELAQSAAPTPAALRLLPLSFAQKFGVLPLRRSGDELLVAVAMPPDRLLAERILLATDCTPRFTILPPSAVALATVAAYEAASRPPSTLSVDAQRSRGTVGELVAQSAAGDTTDAPAVVRVTALMLAEAIRLHASDIHLQPLHGSGNLRFRIDGLLRRRAFVPQAVTKRIIGRIKALSRMDPTDRVHPQDGSASISSGDETYDLRVSTLPVEGGEKLVVRFLPAFRIQGLDAIGLDEAALAALKGLLERRAGMILVTGPTGSGKTTTLHSALHEKDRTEVSIVTIEDPVEYRVPRLAQVQVNPKAGITFASALRSVLRQDPDIVLVGEIRDAETAQLAVQASLTGQLVLSTLHSIDAVSAIPRLLDLGVLRSFLGEALAGVMCQRLVRRLCTECRKPAQAPLTPHEVWLMRNADVAHPMRAAGCATCGFTGYRGRLVIAEVLPVTPEIRQSIVDGAKIDVLRANAHAEGMRNLAESALERIRAGDTSVEEVLAELGSDFWTSLGAPKLPAPRARDTAGSRKVLLVESDPKERAALRGQLEGVGFEVVEADNASSAREIVERSGDFRAMVMDLDGLLASRVQRLLQLRDSLAGAVMPVIALTDERSAALDDAVTAHGSAMLMMKPVEGPEITRALREWLDRLSERSLEPLAET